jgi:hypothetical protein
MRPITGSHDPAGPDALIWCPQNRTEETPCRRSRPTTSPSTMSSSKIAIAPQPWAKSDAYLKVVVQGWQSMAKGLGSVTEMVIQGMCFTPRILCRKARPDRGNRVLRAQSTGLATWRLPATIRGGHRPRCRGAARQDQGPDPDHLRPSCDLNEISDIQVEPLALPA